MSWRPKKESRHRPLSNQQFSSILHLLTSNIDSQIIKGLNLLQEKSFNDVNKVFKLQELTIKLMNFIDHTNYSIQNLSLSVIYSYIGHSQEFLLEVHKHWLPTLVKKFMSCNGNTVKLKLMKILCRQMTYDGSKTVLYENNLLPVAITVLHGCRTVDTKFFCIKIIRMFCTSKDKMNKILNENGLQIVCKAGLAFASDELLHLTVIFIMLYIKRQCTGFMFCEQVLSGSSNLEKLRKVYETHPNYKYEIIDIFIVIFSQYINVEEQQSYYKNITIVEYLRLANLPSMIVDELALGPESCSGKLDYRKLILTLCKLCKLEVPTSHEGVWMQVCSSGGIKLFVQLLASHQYDQEVFLSILQALSGLENLLSNKSIVINAFLEANILPVISKIFSTALASLDSDTSNLTNNSNKCSHLQYSKKQIPTAMKGSLAPSIVNLVSEKANNVIERTDLHIHSEKKKSLMKGKMISGKGYKEMNKIKFRMGNGNKHKRRVSVLSVDQPKAATSEKANVFRRLPFVPGEDTSYSCQTSQASISFSLPSNDIVNPNSLSLHWNEVLEYLLRFLHQTFFLKEDIQNLSKEFLPKLYDYLCKSPNVHKSAINILEDLSKNTSCIQYVLDSFFISSLLVGMEAVTTSTDCSSCILVMEGIRGFVDKIGFFFCHFHQYGQYEIANRLHPSKDQLVKYSAVTAISHVIRCPSLLHDFLIKHRGIDHLMYSLSGGPDDVNLQMYGIAAASSLISNLKNTFFRKFGNNCIFCEVNLHLSDYSKEISKQVSTLTSLTCVGRSCKLEEKANHDCSFKFSDGKVISANREILSDRNNVLRSMLQGSFRESLDTCVVLKDVNSHAMEMLIHFMYGCTCDVYQGGAPQTYMELVFMSQMYFVPELQILATHYLSQSLPKEELLSLVEKFIHSLDSDILNYLFCSLLSNSDNTSVKYRWVDRLLRGGLKGQFLESIRTGLTGFLKRLSGICSCDILYQKSYL